MSTENSAARGPPQISWIIIMEPRESWKRWNPKHENSEHWNHMKSLVSGFSDFPKKNEQSRLPDSWSITWCASWLAGPWIVLHMFAIKSWKIQRIPFLMCSKGISSYLCWEFRCWIMLTLTIGRSVCMPFYHVAAVALLPILARKSPDEFSNETSKTMEGERSR